MMAAQQGDLEMVEKLLDSKANVNAKNRVSIFTMDGYECDVSENFDLSLHVGQITLM